MGLVQSLNNAVSALNVNQQNLNILSQNIANANTPNYSTQVANQQASFINGLPQGVSIASITRKINDFLTAQIRTQSSSANAAGITQSYFQQVENLLGQPGGTNSMDQNVNAFFSALQNMANLPTSSAQTTVVNAASTLAAQISGLAKSIQGLRLQADTEIGNNVNAINSDLKKLQSLNVSLERSAATNENQSGLLDERDATLKDLAKYMDINTLFNEDGSVSVNTTSGITLVGGSTLTQLSYQPASSVQTFLNNGTLGALQVINYSQDGQQVGKVLNLVTSGESGTNGSDSTITSNIPSGALGALVNVRDSVLPKILTQLDQFAATLRDQVNQINNSGVSYPTPGSYTGERLVSGTQESQFSGTVRIALLNSDGSPVASPYSDEPYGLQPLTLDLSTLNTGDGAGNVSMDGLIHAINEYYGQPEAKLELGNLNNVQLALDSASVPDSGNSFNFDFSLNNISKSSAQFFVTGVSVLDSNGVAASSTSPSVNVPSFALASSNTFQTTAGSNLVTITTTGTTNLVEGQTVYLPAVSPSGTVGGISTNLMGGYFTVKNLSGNTFQIEVPGIDATSVTTDTLSASGATGLTSYATAGAGETVRTAANGLVTAYVDSNPSSPYYTVQATIGTVDQDGNVKTSTVTYRVGNITKGGYNSLFGARSQVGEGTVVQPTLGNTLLSASLVDANGNALQKINGVYGNQRGYLKLTSSNGSNSIAIDSLDSKELGAPNSSNSTGGTGQGFSQYFGLNNFFKTNSLTATGDTLYNSALNFTVTKRITDNPTYISTGKLVQGEQPADSSQPANYTYVINSGDNSIAQQLAGLSTLSTSFNAAGGLPAIGTTFSQYAGLIIAQTSSNLTNANNAQKDSQTLLDGYTNQAQNISGVNLDQELANTVIYQNAYSASTRVITIVSTLFQDLLGVIR